MERKQKPTGGSPKFAIPYEVAEIALKYGPTVSKGIREMQDRIFELQGELGAWKAGETKRE